MKPFGYTLALPAVLLGTFTTPVFGQQPPVSQRAFGPVYLSGETADDLPLPPDTYRIAGDVVGPVPLKKVAPEWSPEAKTAHLEGTAIVTGMIGADGIPRDMRVTRPVGFGLDEKALEAISQWRFVPASSSDRTVAVFTSIAIDFRLPPGPSRWHLIEARFTPPEGSARPSITLAPLPAGAGISADAVDEGQVVGASGRTASATIAFDIDGRGVPVHFQVSDASADIWGSEAVRVLQHWRFRPAMKEGHAVSVPATFTFAWGPRELLASKEASRPFVGRPPAAWQPVALSFTVDESGGPKDIRVTEPAGLGTDTAAVAAVSKLKLQPIFTDGSVAGPATIQVYFYPEPPTRRK